jgi:UDP-N-acetylglucosamine 1-carboxyvinyltransferase
MAIALALAKGNSIVTESIFENRFKYVDELARMGSKIKVEGNTAYIEGVEKFSGATVSAPDLRAGAALVVAALSADGFSVIDDIEYIQRGDENFEGKLSSLGGNIEKVDNERDLQKFKLKIG